MNYSFFDNYRLPSHDEIFEASEKMVNLLEDEKYSWRPENSEGKAGGLLDFTDSDIPVVIIPDLHARPYFLKQICEYKISGIPVIDLLKNNQIHLVFVGDALHSEKITKERWFLCQKEFSEGNFSGNYMKEEMADGLSLLMMLFELKVCFPSNFHFLKGNHENVMNLHEGGDFPFRKYADEGQMVKEFIKDYYGDDVLYMISLYENNLPLVYASKKCVVSHGEPFRVFSRQELIDARLNPKVVSGLIWTANNEAANNSVSGTIKKLFINEKLSSNILWFAGHRPVTGKCAFHQKGRFVQMHNPLRRNIVILNDNVPFNPDKNIVSVVGGIYE